MNTTEVFYAVEMQRKHHNTRTSWAQLARFDSGTDEQNLADARTFKEENEDRQAHARFKMEFRIVKCEVIK